MKRILIIFLMFSISGCSTLIQTDPTQSNQAEIESITLPDSSKAYFINWKGKTFMYIPNQTPNFYEIK